MAEKLKKPICQYSQDGVLLNEFESLTQASKELSIPQPNINMCCKGKRRVAGGFVFKYQEVA